MTITAIITISIIVNHHLLLLLLLLLLLFTSRGNLLQRKSLELLRPQVQFRTLQQSHTSHPKHNTPAALFRGVVSFKCNTKLVVLCKAMRGVQAAYTVVGGMDKVGEPNT